MSHPFIHLHVHSHFSLLNALPKIDDLVGKAKELNMPALALTDAGNMYGVIEFYQTCVKKGIKPIIGVDFYVATRKRTDMQAGVDSKRHRLVLLAKDYEGYKNIIKLVTHSQLEGFYYKPRIDRELIEKFNTNLVAIAPSFSSEISAALKMRDIEKAKEKIAWYKSVYPDFYIEITRHPEIDGHEGLMNQLIKLAHETDTPLVAAHDVYYLNEDDRAARDTLMLVNSHSDGSDKTDNDDENFSFISQEKANELFSDIPEALDNTQKIADMCNLSLTLGKWLFPKYIVESGLSYDEELRRIAYEGIPKRGLQLTKEVTTRLDYELEVIKNKGYAQYFLVVSDLLKYAHEHGILTNIRGSVAGSLTTYVTRITNVDPLAYNLPFERFLNPERPSAPDIDMDFADNRRDEVIDYVRNKYGHDKVAQIGTFGTMMAKGAVRDVARAMGYPYEVADRISKLIPMGAQGFPMTIDRALEEVTEFRDLYNKDADTKRIVDMAKKIEGCARHISVHAAGVVIGPEALVEYVPLQYDTKGDNKIITQYDMYAVGEDGVGLLKFDFLGIKNLAILADAIERVKKIENITIDIDEIPLDDAKTFAILAKGQTTGLFQLNGTGMTKFLVDLKPTVIHDINAMVALYRPGPLESIPEYIERKHDPEKIKYLDPRMKDILNMSYGVITYQDDVMMIAIKLGGYSWLEADKLRKAMGKKIPKEMEEQREKLQSGLIKNGMSEKKAKELWKLIEPFAAYGFNKCLPGDTKIIDVSGRIYSLKEVYEKNIKLKTISLSETLILSKHSVDVVMENGEKEVFELKTRSGRTVKATANHPFFVFSGWKNLENLKVGEKIAVPRKIDVFGKKTETKKAAVLGYLLSEGNLCHPHGVYFYSTQIDEVNDFIKFAKIFKDSTFTVDRSKSAIAVYCGNKEIQNWIKELGLFYHKATEKFIPEEIFTYDKKSLAILIGKMWQGDGCISIQNQHMYYATSSKRLAHDVRHLLLRFGILSTIHTKKFKYRGTVKPGYTVTVSHQKNIRKFNQEIGKHLIGKKKEDLYTLTQTKSDLAKGTKDTIPAEIIIEIKKSMREKNISVKEISKALGISSCLFYHDKRKIGFQREIINKIGVFLKSKKLKDLANSDIYWDEVVYIKKSGIEMTYDLTVSPHHNFVANDIIVHNSHAASYGRVAYQTAYMKANYPAIYMSAVLTADSGDVEKIGEFIAECRRMGIPILPPDINESFSQFTVVPGEKQTIRFGLVTIKNFGQGIATAIIDERKRGGHFTSLVNFLDRVRDRNLNKKSLEALIKVGAIDSFGIDRGVLIGNIENLLAYNKEHEKLPTNQDSLFGFMTDTSTLPTLKLAEVGKVSEKDRLAWEKELLGLYISGHPLDPYREKISSRDMDIARAKLIDDTQKEVIIPCIIEMVKPLNTKKGDMMAFLTLSDFSGSIEAVAFPKLYESSKSLLQVDKCLAVKGKVNERNGVKSFVIEKVKEL